MSLDLQVRSVTGPMPDRAASSAAFAGRGLTRRLRPLIAAIVAFVCACGWTPPACATPAAATSASPSVVSAVNGGQALQLLAPPQLDAQLAAMQTDGVQVVRGDAPWANIEPQPPGPDGHVWQLATTDAWVRALASHHLTWEPVIDYAVGWAKTCPGFCAPTSDSTYAAFAQEIASRYGAHGSFWAQNPSTPYYPAQIFEIWNEENISMYWMPAARYATLYAAAHSAIHAVDSTASVIVGGLADDTKDFNPNTDYPAWYVQQMLTADPALHGNIDGFGLHPYGSGAWAVQQWVAHFRGVLIGLGEGSAPIDITEVGWPDGDSSHEGWRALQMSTLALSLFHSNCGIRIVAPYDWINPDTSDPWQDFGLVNQGESPTLRPSGTAWLNGMARARSQPGHTLCPSSSPSPPGEVTAGATSLISMKTYQSKTTHLKKQRRRHDRVKSRKRVTHPTRARHSRRA